MFGTYCRLGVPKIQKVQIITPPPLFMLARKNERNLGSHLNLWFVFYVSMPTNHWY